MPIVAWLLEIETGLSSTGQLVPPLPRILGFGKWLIAVRYVIDGSDSMVRNEEWKSSAGDRNLDSRGVWDI